MVVGNIRPVMCKNGACENEQPEYVINDSRGEGNALTFSAADGRIALENANVIRPRWNAALASWRAAMPNCRLRIPRSRVVAGCEDATS